MREYQGAPVKTVGDNHTVQIEGDHRTGQNPRGYYIRTFTGKQFYWDEIEKAEFDIRDIAHALAMNCRWTGHVKEFYSVAQHSVHASFRVPKHLCLSALLHDASEAYVHDTPSPLKWYLRDHDFSAFSNLEKRIDKAIFKQFKLPYPRDPIIKEVDLRLLATENRDLMAPGEERIWMIKPYSWHIAPLSPADAEALFLHRFADLMKKRRAFFEAIMLFCRGQEP